MKATMAVAGLALLAGMGLSGRAVAAPLEVAGSPTYDAATGNGMMGGLVPAVVGWGVNNFGMAVGSSRKYVSGSSLGSRAVRWDATGMAAMELDSLGTDSSGYTEALAYAVNDAGTAVGYCRKFISGTNMGYRAVRWDAGATAATELDCLGTDAGVYTWAYAHAVNSAGTAVGYCRKFVSGIGKGNRAVRWDAGGTAATELDCLGTDAIHGSTTARANAINDAGTAVGYSLKYVSGSYMGSRAVRWDAGGTAAMELGVLGTDPTGFAAASAYAVNSAGTAVGYCRKLVLESSLGLRAVRWDAGGTAATELDCLGTDATGSANAGAFAVNDAGTAVGYSLKYVSGSYMGSRAVRWDAGGTAATELGCLGTDAAGSTSAEAYAVNDTGTAVGWSEKYVSGSYVGRRAVAWLPDGTGIDLNDLGVVAIPAGGTWTLMSAKALSADGWVAGEGDFDPDGPGPLDPYSRLWVGQIGLGGAWLNTTGANNTWGKGANWSTGTPAIQRDAVFDKPAAYGVAFDDDQSARAAQVTAGDVTFAVGARSLTLTDGLSISAGARLASNGTIAAAVTNAGTLAPGNSPGTLTIYGDLDSTGVLEFEINGTGAGQFDRLVVSGEAGVGGTVKLVLGYSPALGDSFDLLDWGSRTGGGCGFDLSQAALGAGLSWDTTAFAVDGTVSVVPEPATIGLLALGGLGLMRRRKK